MTTSQPQEHSPVGICVLLGVAVLLILGQSVRYDFVNYEDDQGNPARG